MYDNKVRLSQDVLEKAEQIATEWGLKNARAAIEAVFRRYSDEYLNGRDRFSEPSPAFSQPMPFFPRYDTAEPSAPSSCAALDELDDLLGL